MKYFLKSHNNLRQKVVVVEEQAMQIFAYTIYKRPAVLVSVCLHSGLGLIRLN